MNSARVSDLTPALSYEEREVFSVFALGIEAETPQRSEEL
jgi:hypothetical protein